MSGCSEQSQRYAEQLVLYVKANNILVATLKDVELEVARSSQEPPENLTKGVSKYKHSMCVWYCCHVAGFCYTTLCVF